ncbi:hypothetical protein [Kocuria sp.]|uniref:hypothetical protein n=1 Tax=Kocuria sp. TaxID=1871328 RepID=UPI0026DFA6F8|nr:hypothetical protein [Kocuria sp.]MDO5619470.1 hypothetical protein [Kocuria sp.]
MSDSDQILIETTKVHRRRLQSALAYGPMPTRKVVKNNIGRFLGSAILAAVMCIGCLATGYVLNILESQRNEKALTAFRNAAEANPIQPGNGLREDEATGLLVDENTGEYIDPQTGFTVDPETKLATDPEGRTIDIRLNWYYDSSTGYYTDPASGITVDPQTLTVVEDE